MGKDNTETEVLIVGAGPSGLMMACQLAIHNIGFRIIDKKEFPTSNSGAMVIQARSVEIFSQMGIAQQAIEAGFIPNNLNILFNGKPLLKIPVKDIGSGLTLFPYLLLVKQSKTEQVLTEFINKRGFYIGRRTELLDFSQDSSGVVSRIKDPDGNIVFVKSHYLIAADGGQSLIRQQLNIPFIGKSHQKSLFIIDCKADTDIPVDDISISFSNNAISGFFPLPDGKWRVDGTIPTTLKTKPRLSFADIEEHFSDRLKMKIKLHSPEWFSVFHSHQHYAASFQQDCCFLIGDAAHIHSPVGAQGMNTGLQDAYNLAWKLAFVLKGKAYEELLKTYSTERLPVAKNNIRVTDRIFNLITSDHFITKSFRNYIAPFLIRTVFPTFVQRKRIRQYIFKSISEINVNYRESVMALQSSIRLFPSLTLRPGDRLPYVQFKEKDQLVNVQDKVNGTCFHLLIFCKVTPSEEMIKRIKKHGNFLSYEVILHSVENHHLFKMLSIKNKGLLLIRPDMYIAFHSKSHNIKHLNNKLKLFLYA
jgi:2-polyprenyl-6-methoxyphenol hydroxylase-like FAD-dependent oxidoreductase